MSATATRTVLASNAPVADLLANLADGENTHDEVISHVAANVAGYAMADILALSAALPMPAIAGLLEAKTAATLAAQPSTSPRVRVKISETEKSAGKLSFSGATSLQLTACQYLLILSAAREAIDAIERATAGHTGHTAQQVERKDKDGKVLATFATYRRGRALLAHNADQAEQFDALLSAGRALLAN